MPVIRDMILDRLSIKKEKNALILVVGNTGEGKSEYCNSFSLELDPVFNNDRVAHKTANSFVHILNHDKTIHRGSCVVWDDAGKGLKRDEWYLAINRIIRDILQTFRIDGLIVFINCPDPSFIDKKVLKLFHYWVELDHIDYEQELAYSRFYSIQVNKKTEKIYWHRPTYIADDGSLTRIDFHVTRKTPGDFDREYRRRKNASNKLIKLDAEKKLNRMEEEEKIENMTVGEIIEEISADFGKYIDEYHGRKFFDLYRIMSKYKIGRDKATQVKKDLDDRFRRHLGPGRKKRFIK